MITLDENYHLRNNNIHGVELVFIEEKENKEGELKEYEKVLYYPNPILAIRKWIELTNNSTNISELENFYNSINQKLEIIKNEFINNNRKL